MTERERFDQWLRSRPELNAGNREEALMWLAWLAATKQAQPIAEMLD